MQRTILIVDDNAINRQVLSSSLRKFYTLLEASSGEEALELLHQRNGDISAVLLDIVMAGIDGYEVLRHIRADFDIAQIPVIMVTGSEDEASRVKAISVGANDFIPKPYSPEIILHCLKNNIALYETAKTVRILQRDRLTGLYTREAFFEKVCQMVSAQEAGYYIMACFDIDRFKVINDQYGTDKGDEVLRHIAAVFKDGFHANGGIVCRIAADNFAVLYPASFQDSPELAKIRQRSAHIDGLAVPIIFSIGRYVVDDISLPVNIMFDRASIAAASVKGRYDIKIAQYDENMRRHLLVEQEIVFGMEKALAAKQFEVWYQPQYNHSTGASIGAEALVRWRHPKKGLIPPCDFIPLFEKNGFIYTLDKFVWEQVCIALRSWLDEGKKPLPVSVNISRYDLLCPDLIAVITGLLRTYRLPTELLRLEVTESAFAGSTQQIISTVKQFVSLGFTVEIDDFGSGYSSLNTLKDVPAQIIKLDMKFLADAQDSDRGGNIVESVVRMAKWLDMSVIAEGVETKQQADYLRSIGCSYMQGYLFSMPMPVDEYVACCAGTAKEEQLLALQAVDNFDNSTFWSPDSMDTLIFNSYVGGACIFEYHNGSIELIRATEKYAQVIGSAGMTVEAALKLIWADHLDEQYKNKVTADLKQAVTTREEVTGEYIFTDLPGCPHETYLRSTMRVIATAGDRYLVYCTNENITAQRQSEKREREVVNEMQLIMEKVSCGICASVYAPDGLFRVLFANDRFYDVYGYTREQVETELSGDLMKIVNPKDLERIGTTIEKLLHEKGTVSYEYRCIRRDGKEIAVRCVNTVTSFAGIGDSVLLAVIDDITEQFETELLNRRLSAQMQSVMDNVDLGIIAALVTQENANYVFANDRYYSMLGYTKQQFAQEVASPYSTVAPQDSEMVRSATGALCQVGQSSVIEYHAVKRDGTLIVLRSAISVGTIAGIDSPVQLSIIRDITAEKETEQRERQATEQAQTVMRDIDSGLTATILRENRIEVFFSNEQFYRMRGYTKQQYRAEVKDYYELVHPDDREHVRKNALAAYTSEKPVHDEYRIICRDGTERWFRVSMSKSHFTGLDEPVILSVYSDITAEKSAEQAKTTAITQMQTMMDDMPGGFARLRVSPDGSIKPDYVNKGFCNITGMSLDEVMQVYGENSLAGVHPDDVPAAQRIIADLMREGGSRQLRYRLRRSDGEYVWMNIICRITQDDQGNQFLSSYYTDASEQVRTEEHQRALLDNLPGGAGVYELKHGIITLIYQNRSYWELVGLSEESEPDMTPLSAIHPDEIPVITQEITLAIQQNRDISCDIRLRHQALGYIPVHLAGRIVSMPEHCSRIYATFTPITAEGQTYQQVLPLLLAAMMESTSDFTFAKDKDLRYISASRAFAQMVGIADERSIVGKTDYDIFSKELAERYRRDDMEMLSSGKAYIDMVEPIPPVNGVPHYASTSKYVLRDSIGSIIGLYGNGRDITQSLAQETRLNLVANSIPGGLAAYVCSLGNLTMNSIKLVYFNDGFCRLFGVTREEYQKKADVNPTSMVFEEDRDALVAQWSVLIQSDIPMNCVFRVHLENGGFKWISLKAVAADRNETAVVINALFQDITDQHELIDRLRISEEENKVASRLGDNIIARFMIQDRTLTISPEVATAYGLAHTVENVPQGPIALGMIAPESVDAYTGFYESILRGSKAATAIYKQKYFNAWRWTEAKSSTIFSADGMPVKALISLTDVTDRLKKETIYKKWQQSLENKQLESYTLFRCNLNDNFSYALKQGALLSFQFDEAGVSFNDRARTYINQCVHADDRDKYTAFVNSDTMLAGYYRGHRSDVLEYRELLPDGGYRWLRLTVDLVEYPNSSDVEAYLMYENIDAGKRAELETKQLSETDPLTGLLNRTTFISRVEEILRAAKPETRHVMLMLDIDGFKLVNDVFGHTAGDQALIEVANSLRSILRRYDLVARMGGDEYLVFLTGIPDDKVAAYKAQQICAACRKTFSAEVQISGSVGVALAPRDGVDFATLYKKVDCALYHVKGTGKDNFAFYQESMEAEHLAVERGADRKRVTKSAINKRRVLIVDDNAANQALLQNMLQDEFVVETARDGNSALIRLRHYGSAVSAVLLDLMMPGMDGFAMLEQMQKNDQMRTIPVIIVSGDESREACLKAVRGGATDFVTKPVDPDILRVRLHSAVSKAENELLRAANSVLEIKREERIRFETAVRCAGTAFLELDWLKSVYTYYPSISEYLYGTYDKRGFWQILLSDMMLDTKTVKQMQQHVHAVAENRETNAGSIVVRLMTPTKEYHRFRMNVRKITDGFQLTTKLIIALNDLDFEP